MSSICFLLILILDSFDFIFEIEEYDKDCNEDEDDEDCEEENKDFKEFDDDFNIQKVFASPDSPT